MNTGDNGFQANFWLDLPNSFTTRDGIEWNPRMDEWNIGWIQSHSNVKLHKIKSFLNPELFAALKYVLMTFYGIKSVDHCGNSYERFYRFVHKTCAQVLLGEVTEVELKHYLMILGKERESELGGLKSFLLYWNQLGVPGVTNEAVAFLESLRLKGNEKGRAVLTMDPYSGPFTNAEFDLIIESVSIAFTDGSLSAKEAAVFLLEMSIGVRPIQIAALKLRDFTAIGNTKDGTFFRLKVPRAKKRNSVIRTEFREATLSPIMASLLNRSIEHDEKTIPAVLKLGDDRPLFACARRAVKSGFHYASQGITNMIRIAGARLQIKNEATGEPLRLTPSRMRRTLATRAAAEGAGELVLAELLDHEDTQNVGVYTKLTDKMYKRIDEKMAVYYGRRLNAFKGHLNEGKLSSLNPSKSISRASDFSQPLGDCTRNQECHLLAPVACYTCRKFRPWKDGPHRSFLNELLEERNKIFAEASDVMYASVNDLAIYACAEVVDLCTVNREI